VNEEEQKKLKSELKALQDKVASQEESYSRERKKVVTDSIMAQNFTFLFFRTKRRWSLSKRI
jgi:hypothetical protein